MGVDPDSVWASGTLRGRGPGVQWAEGALGEASVESEGRSRQGPRNSDHQSVGAGPTVDLCAGLSAKEGTRWASFRHRGLQRHTLPGSTPGRRGGWGEWPAVGVGSEGLCGKCRYFLGDGAYAQHRELLSTAAGLSAGRFSQGPIYPRSWPVCDFSPTQT